MIDLSKYRVVDLTVTLGEEYPCVWPGHIPYMHQPHSWFEKTRHHHGVFENLVTDYYYNAWFMVDEHTGTHFDAPTHFFSAPDSGLPNASPLGLIFGEDVSLEKMMGNAVVIDLTDRCDEGKNGESPAFTKKDLLSWEEKNGKIEPGSVVLFRSGWSKYYLRGSAGDHYMKTICDKTTGGWPSPDVDAIEFLHDERGVNCLGTDGGSIGLCQGNAPHHIAGLSRQMVYVEALCNLDQLPIRGAQFLFLPIKLEYASGGPGRAIAFVPKDE